MDWIVIICGSIAIGVLVHLIVTEMFEGRMKTLQIAGIKFTRNQQETGILVSLHDGSEYKHVITLYDDELAAPGEFFEFKAHHLIGYLDNANAEKES